MTRIKITQFILIKTKWYQKAKEILVAGDGYGTKSLP
jgi:hypothetical protein